MLSSVEVLQSDGTFTSGPNLPEPIAQHCIEGVDDNRVFMSGGDVVGTNVGNKKAYMYSFVSQVREPQAASQRRLSGTDIHFRGNLSISQKPLRKLARRRASSPLDGHV